MNDHTKGTRIDIRDRFLEEGEGFVEVRERGPVLLTHVRDGAGVTQAGSLRRPLLNFSRYTPREFGRLVLETRQYLRAGGILASPGKRLAAIVALYLGTDDFSSPEDMHESAVWLLPLLERVMAETPGTTGVRGTAAASPGGKSRGRTTQKSAAVRHETGGGHPGAEQRKTTRGGHEDETRHD